MKSIGRSARSVATMTDSEKSGVTSSIFCSRIALRSIRATLISVAHLPRKLNMKTEYLADHPAHVPTVAAWQQAQFGYLTPALTLEDRTERLHRSLQKDALPMAFISLSDSGAILGSAGILAATITHKHLTPWLSSVYVPIEHRGKGIASALSLRAVTEATRLGFERLFLFRTQQ